MGVVKLADYRPQLEVVEHRVADTEDGFMRVANEITDSLLMADLTVRQLKVMLAIMRKTYGFNKPMDRLTNTQIAAMTGIHHTHVCAAKRQLIERKFLIADGVKIGVNKVVSQWISQDSLTLAKTANKTLAESANGYKPSQLNTKDNIQKTINTNTPLPPTRDDGSIVYLHVTPFPYEVVEEHCILLGNLFTKFISQVGGLGAARIAAMMLRQSLKAEIDNGRTGPNIVDEIQRLTVVIHNVGGQWKTTPLEVAFKQGIIDPDEYREVEGEVVFFMVSSAIQKANLIAPTVGTVIKMYDGQLTSSSGTAFRDSLQTSKPDTDIPTQNAQLETSFIPS